MRQHVIVDTDGLADSGSGLVEVAHALARTGHALRIESAAGAGAAGDDLAVALDRFAAASSAYADQVAAHLGATGWLADHLADDLDRATGGP